MHRVACIIVECMDIASCCMHFHCVHAGIIMHESWCMSSKVVHGCPALLTLTPHPPPPTPKNSPRSPYYPPLLSRNSACCMFVHHSCVHMSYQCSCFLPPSHSSCSKNILHPLLMKALCLSGEGVCRAAVVCSLIKEARCSVMISFYLFKVSPTQPWPLSTLYS